MKTFHKRIIASLMIFLISFQTCFVNISYADTIIESLDEEDNMLDIATPSNAKPKEDNENFEDSSNIENNDDTEDDENFKDDEELENDLENNINDDVDTDADYNIATPSNAKPNKDKELENDLIKNDDFDVFNFELEWENTDFTDGLDFNLKEERNEAKNTVKMVVSYANNDSIRDNDYNIGDLKIKVKGIGDISRKGIIEAKVGADRESDTNKTRDWSYTWDSLNDIYTFNNNNYINANDTFSGYFDLVWEIDARDSKHNYLQDNIQAELSINGIEGSIKSDILTFTNETKRDKFSVEIVKGEIYSTERLTDNLDKPEDYNFIRYNMAVLEERYTRGLSEKTYLFNPDINNIGEGAIILSSSNKYIKTDDGVYKIELDYNKPIEDQYIYVAYPKTSYTIDKNFDVSLDMYGIYNEEDENELLAQSKITIYPSKDFEFVYISDGKYWFSIDSYYDYRNMHYNGRDISGSKMKSGTVETFYITGGLGEIKKEDGIYTLEVADDFIYIQTNDGNYRRLKDNEYEFRTITIPDKKSFENLNGIQPEDNKYTVKIYGVSSTSSSDLKKLWDKSDGTLIKSVDIDDTSEVVYFKNEIKAISVCIEGVTSSIKKFEFPVQIYFKLNNTSNLSQEKQDNLTDGKLINTAYDREYKNGIWVEPNVSGDGYIDETGLELAKQDMDTYGYLLVRDRSDIEFYNGGSSDYNATSSIDNVTILKEGGIKATYNMGAYFSFKNEDYPNKFSLYTILPENVNLDGYEIPEDIWDIMELEGLGLSKKELAEACTPYIDLNYKGSGRTYIRLNFDFKDKELSQIANVNAAFKVKSTENKSVYIQNCVTIDSEIDEYTYNKYIDDGSYGYNDSLFSDINGDGNTESLLAYGQTKYIIDNSATSSEFRVLKFSKTDYSDGWTQEIPYVEYGKDYQYRLCVRNGSGKSTNIIIKDIIENESTYKGIFQSVEVEGGLNPTIYYSDSSEPGNLNSGYWVETKGNNIKAIALDFGMYELGAGKEINVIIHMKAPSDTSLKDQIMKNRYSVELDMKNGNLTKHVALDSNIASVKLSPILRKIVITKKDASSQEVLQGAYFKLFDEDGKIVGEATSNQFGYAIISNIPAENGTKYTLKEIKAPTGYEKMEDRIINMNEDHVYLDIEDVRKTGTVKIYKTNNLSKDVPVIGATYTLYDEDNNEIDSAVTDNEGLAKFNDIEWGNYTVKETQAPDGYELNNTEYPVKINKNTVDKEVVINTIDVQKDVNIKIIKYASDVQGNKTTETLEGIEFELYDSLGKRVGLYKTDINGEIHIKNIPYGNYYLREYNKLDGYQKLESDVEFELSPEKNNINIEVYNQREPGKIIITKKDNLGNLVSGVEFSLYNETKETIVGKMETNSLGVIEFNNLEWGKYYLKETKAPEYYQLKDEFIEAKITNKQREVMVNIVNETVKGSIVLTKVDEKDKSVKLSNAKYALYTINNVLIGEYISDEKGEIRVDNLEWGSYYFKEIEAPSGYGISNENIRFSINAANAGIVQQLTATDPPISKYIKITKTIYADDVNFNHGLPQFMFKVYGKDIHNNEHIYCGMLTFDDTSIEENGYISQTIVVGGLTAGIYTVSEEQTVRYAVKEVKNVVNGEVKDDTAIFDLSINDKEYGEVEFVNRNYEQQKFSHTHSVNNIVKQDKKPTAIKVEYADDEVKAQGDIDKDKLTVKVIYDDGTTKELSSNEYELIGDKFTNVNGDYSINVEYTEGGVTVSGSDIVTITGMIEQIVKLEAKLKNDEKLEVETEITEDMIEVIAVYNTGETKVLVSGEYIISPKNVPGTSSSFDIDIRLNLGVIPNNGYNVDTKVTASVNLREPLLEIGKLFNKHIKETTIEVEFTDIAAPDDVEIFDVSDLKNHSVVAWYADNKLVVSSQRTGLKVIANEDSSEMFYRGEKEPNNITTVDASMLDTSKINNINKMFYNCTNLVTLKGSWEFGKVTDMGYAFAECQKLSSIDTSRWKTENVINMEHLFSNCYELNHIDTSNWKTDRVTDMKYMFSSCHNLDSINLLSWNTNNVTDMQYMFYECRGLTNLDLSSLNTSNVIDMKYMFCECNNLASLKLDKDKWDTSNVTDMSIMFYNCKVLDNLDTSEWKTGKVTNMRQMFNFCTKLQGIDATSWDTSNVTDMCSMFHGCESLKYLRLNKEKWNTSKVTDMSTMFYECKVLDGLDVSGWDTSNVTNMKQMFSFCALLSTLDISNWKTNNVTDMFAMFRACDLLDGINVSEWNTSNVTNMSEMFCDCHTLTTLSVSKWDTSNVTNMSLMFTFCGHLSGLDVKNWETGNVTNMNSMFKGCWSMGPNIDGSACTDCSGWNVDKVTDNTDFRKNGTDDIIGIALPKAWTN